MAMSPPPPGLGKESTSVGRSFRRKRRFRSRNCWLLVIRMSTWPETLASFCARRAKRSRAAVVIPSSGVCRTIKAMDFLLLQRLLWPFLFPRLLGQFERHLLALGALIVGAHDP